jgi:hypothetical protein
MLGWFGALLALAAVTVWAAEVTGKWKAEFQTPNGDTRTSIFNLKAEGEKLTGTVESPRGSAEIQEGKVSGDAVSFVVIRNFNGNEFKMRYSGKVAGDEMKLKVEIGDGDRTFEMTAKREK